MADPSDDPDLGRNLRGLKYLDKLLPLFDRLHDVGTRRDKAGNRKLHFDQYCAWSCCPSSTRSSAPSAPCKPPACSSRSDASSAARGPPWARFPRRSRSSTRSGWRRSSPSCWDEAPPSHGVGKEHVRRVLTAVDGSVVKTLASLAEAAYLRDQQRPGRTAAGGSTRTSRSTAACPSASTSPRRSTAARPTRSTSCGGLAAGPLLRDGPLVRPVHAVERHRRRRQQLRLPHPRQQHLDEVIEERPVSRGGATRRRAPRRRGQAGDLAQGRGAGRTIPSG